MGLRDHFRRSSPLPPPAYPPLYAQQSSIPPPAPYTQHHPPFSHTQQHASPGEPPPYPQPSIPTTLHLTYDSWSGRTARLTTQPDHSSPTIFHLSTHSRNPQIRLTSTASPNAPPATATINIAQSIDITLPSTAFSIPSLGWNVWEFPYASPALGGRVIKWETPEGAWSDNMICVFADGTGKVAQWRGSGWAIGSKQAGRLEVLPEVVVGLGLQRAAMLMEEMSVVALGLWTARMSMRGTATGGVFGVV